jgi:hypothetical protein
MSRLRLVSAVLFPAVLTSPALACLNDRQTDVFEREFRSRYRSPGDPGSADSTPPAELSALPSTSEWNPLALGMTGAGMMLVLGSTWLTFRKLHPGPGHE